MKPFDRKYIGLVLEIAYCQFKLKDQSTLLGFLWSFLHPLLILFVFLAFFKERIGKEIDHYTIFMLIGILHYTHFANSTASSMTTLSRMRQLTRNVILPKELLVLGSVLAFSLEFVLSMTICVAVAYFSGVQPSWTISAIPLIFFLQILMTMWVSLLLSCIHVFIPDIAHVYQVFLRILLFTTPVFYTASFLGTGTARFIVLLNPLAQVIEFSRSILLKSTPFPFTHFFTFIVVNVFLNYICFKLFKKFEPGMVERA